MKVMGLDFTSAPSFQKPLTLAVGEFTGGALAIHGLETLPDFEQFERLLARPGPWILGIDFPFGQPRKLISNLNLPSDWSGYVAAFAAMGKPGFVENLRVYRESRAPGDKQHLRAIDVVANSRSPMMLYGVPVGKMFLEGAPRLLSSSCSIVPVRPTNDDRVVVEAYPSLVARRWTCGAPYKSDAKRKQTAEMKRTRLSIADGVRSEELRAAYGIDINFESTLAECWVEDGSGDQLDAVLCSIQAAWAYTQREEGFGVPADCDTGEGWMCDPAINS